MTLATGTMVVLGPLLILGGWLGYRKGSRVSLMAGSAAGAALLVAALVAAADPRSGTLAGIVICGILSIVFAIRFTKTRKFMPSGLMLFVVDLGLALLVVSLFLG